MRVVLKRDAFIGGVFYRKGNMPPANIPSHLKDQLPKDARIIDTSGVEKMVKKEKQAHLKDFDEERANAEEEAKVHNKVNKEVKK